MGDDDEGQSQPALQVHQLELGFAAQFLVERRHRLVEQQYARTLDQRTRERHALALAAGQFVRLAPAEIFKLHQSQHVGDPFGDFPLRQTFLLEAEGDIGFDIKVRKQRIALKHHVDGTPMRRHRRKVDPVEQDTAAIRPLEARDQAQQRGLAAAGRTEQREELALIDVERKLIDRGEGAEAFAQAFDPQQRLQRRIGPRREAPLRKAPCRSDGLHRCPVRNGAPPTAHHTLEHFHSDWKALEVNRFP